MTAALIVRQSDFDELCEQIREAGIVAFDTEFISEFTYRPELCLLQFATPERVVAVDPFEIPQLDAWWELMIDPAVRVIVHGGREEIRFCLTNTRKRPVHLWDVQVAEGLRSRSFPLGYEALVKRVTGHAAHGRETRTDWRRRPLSDTQIRYALDDVRYLIDIFERQSKGLDAQGRVSWAEAEIERLITETEAERAPESWMRLPGLHRLSSRELAIAREVWQWRESEAQQRNRPVRRILRDDLVIELARRRPMTEDELVATRDLNRPEYRKTASAIIEAIERGTNLPNDQLPTLPPQPDESQSHDEQVLGQLLGLALANRCAEQNLAQTLVGKSADLRELVRWHVFGERDGALPRLMQGWRAEVCGQLLTDVLDGKISLRVADPQSDHPLVFEQRESDGVVRPVARRKRSRRSR